MTGIDLVEPCCWRRRSVVGPSMSGIITSSRMASGPAERAKAVPAAPPLAVQTFQLSVNWRLSFATSRMSYSSSMTRICLGGMLRVLFRCRRFDQPDHVSFEVGQAAPALGEELRRSEPETGLVGASDIDCRVDQKRDVLERGALPKRIDDGEAVNIREAEVEDDETRLMLVADANGFHTTGGMKCL